MSSALQQPDRQSDATARMLTDALASRFSSHPDVVAVTLAGSRVTAANDDDSDVDLYVYRERDLPLSFRRALIEEDARQYELDNQFWEPGDEWLDRATGIHIDVMYRDPAWVVSEIDQILVRHKASVGYSTCIWANVREAEILFDRSGWFAELQARARVPYPEELRRNVIATNHPILRDAFSSYLRQLEKAIARDDAVSVSHRITALLASYFDIVFALNRVPHPGEKRLLELAAGWCETLPDGMDRDVRCVLELASSPRTGAALVDAVNDLLDGLDDLLKEGMPCYPGTPK